MAERTEFMAQLKFHTDEALSSKKDAAGERAGMATHMADLGSDNFRHDLELGLLCREVIQRAFVPNETRDELGLAHPTSAVDNNEGGFLSCIFALKGLQLPLSFNKGTHCGLPCDRLSRKDYSVQNYSIWNNLQLQVPIIGA